MDSRGCYPPQHQPKAPHQRQHCPAPDCKDKVFEPCVLPECHLDPSHDCEGVCPPKVQYEIVVFRKRYKCCNKNTVQNCQKDCPWVQTIQYIIEPVWEQLDVRAAGDDLCSQLNDLKYKELNQHSSLVHCLQCNFDKCYINKQVPRNCRNSVDPDDDNSLVSS
uniref:Uncharacterized protein n=1 Tax=viral metagenome TaxID=1070528 RepID=A0A6C0C269_9ZZZZ